MKLNFEKSNGLITVIIQDDKTLQVLMLGYMNEEAYRLTLKENKVTFFSRSKNRLWTKGESSGNFLHVKDVKIDCDQDTILIKARPEGPTCHKGSVSCFNENTSKGFLYKLEETIQERIERNDETSYTNQIFRKGINKVAQKVGEEAVELVIEAMDQNDELFKNEAADLLYHFLILLKAKNMNLEEIEQVLEMRVK